MPRAAEAPANAECGRIGMLGNIMKTTLKIGVAVILVLVISIQTGIVGMSCPRIIENQPLEHPIKVSYLDASTLRLPDGRLIGLQGPPVGGETWGAILENNNYLVDLEPEDGGEIAIDGSVRSFTCGTPWAQPIRIPLIAADLKQYRRECIGFGTEAWWIPAPPQPAGCQHC
jgi:hypothetical protein